MSQRARSKVRVKVTSTQRSKVKSQNGQDEIKNANQTDKIHGFNVIRTFRRSTLYIISYRLETAKIQQQVNISSVHAIEPTMYYLAEIENHEGVS